MFLRAGTLFRALLVPGTQPNALTQTAIQSLVGWNKRIAIGVSWPPDPLAAGLLQVPFLFEQSARVRGLSSPNTRPVHFTDILNDPG